MKEPLPYEALPDKPVAYTWTNRDHTVAQMWPKHIIENAKHEDRYVTAYRILPDALLPKCREWKPGDTVSIPLTKTQESLYCRLFLPKGFEWVEIPSEVTGYKTIEELCAKLFAHNPHRFVGHYYDFSKKTAQAKSETARILFEYWQNSAYRHAVISSGYDYNMPQFPSKPTEQSGKKLRWVLAKKPVPVKTPAAPGSQNIQAVDPELDKLSADITEMRMKAARIMELLKISERIMRDRLTLAQRFTALHTLVDVCANAHSEANPGAVAMADTTRKLEKKVLGSLRNKPIAELIEESNAPAELVSTLRKAFGQTDDIAAEIRRLGTELVQKITTDADFAARCGSWGKIVLKKGLASTPAFRARYDRLTIAFIEVLSALQEVETPDGFADTLLDILKRVPEAPITDDNAIEKIGNRSALDVALAFSGPSISVVTTGVGNTPGPPSLYISVVQLRAAKKITAALAAAGHGDGAGCATLLKELMGQLRRALGHNQALADKLEDAIKNNKQEALLGMKSEVLDEIGAPLQSSVKWRIGIVLLQCIAFAMAVAATGQKGTVEFADVLGLIGSGVTMVVPIADLALTAMGRQASASLAKLSMGLGAFSAFIGIILAGMQLGEAEKSKDKLALFAAGTAMLGNFCLMVGSIGWYGVAIPGLNTAALLLILASTGASMVAIVRDEAIPITRKIAKAIIAAIRSHPMYDVLRDEPEFRKLMADLDDKVDDVFLPQPQNNIFVTDRLHAAGFTRAEIGVIVEKTGAPLSPSFGLSGAY